jgi:hypothetical protein
MYSRLRSDEKLKDELVLAMLDRNPRTAALARATQGCLQMQSPPLGSVETRSHHALPKEPKNPVIYGFKSFSF